MKDPKIQEYMKHPWNFNNITQSEDSFLQFTGDFKISGITDPWVYVGMQFSSFCWHNEDVMMYSINYMHKGGSKVWYCIPPHDRAKADKVIRNKLAQNDPNVIHELLAVACPTYLAQNGIKVYKTEQKPGEFILTFPESYHCGFSTGLNVAEAVNFTSPTWLQTGLRCIDYYRKSKEKQPVVPMHWVAYGMLRDQSRNKYSDMGVMSALQFFEAEIEDHLEDRRLAEKAYDLVEDEIHLASPSSIDDFTNCSLCIDLCFLSYLEC